MPPNTHRSPLPQGEGAIGSSAAGVHGPSPQPSPAGRGCQIGSATAALTAPGLRKQPTYPRKTPRSKPLAPPLRKGGKGIGRSRRRSIARNKNVKLRRTCMYTIGFRRKSNDFVEIGTFQTGSAKLYTQKHRPPLGPLCPFKTNHSSPQGGPGQRS